MAEIIHTPNQHSCYKEVEAQFPARQQYVGTIAKCGCGRHMIVSNDQRDGNYWTHHFYGGKSSYDR